MVTQHMSILIFGHCMSNTNSKRSSNVKILIFCLETKSDEQIWNELQASQNPGREKVKSERELSSLSVEHMSGAVVSSSSLHPKQHMKSFKGIFLPISAADQRRISLKEQHSYRFLLLDDIHWYNYSEGLLVKQIPEI